MAFQLSPGVNVSEIDLTTVVPSVATSTGAFAGSFAWGPVNEIVTISDETRLVERFGKPNTDNYKYWFTAANFLAYSNNLKVVRAANTTSTLNATSDGTGVLIENEIDYDTNHSAGANTYGVFAAKYAGDLGNGLRVQMVDSATFSGWEYETSFTSAPATSDYAARNGASDDELHIVVIDVSGKFSNGSANTVLEKFGFVSKASDAKTEDGSSNYYVNVLRNRSKYVYWMSHPAGTTNWGTRADSGNPTFSSLGGSVDDSLSGGADGTVGIAEVVDAWDKFLGDDIDISLILSGPADATLAGALIDDIAEVRKDCVVFLSPLMEDVVDNYGSEVTDITTYRNTTLNKNSSYAVMDCNWKYQYDKYNDVYRWVPLNGDIAGLCARTDRERDPWYSPAGLGRGIIKNVIKLAWNPNKTDRDNLYTIGVNPVVSFAGEGTMLYGDKTLLSRPSAFDRINVRRLFIVLEKAIARASRSSLFQFNDAFTRAQFVSLVEPFLRDVKGRRGITDFRVVCDETNNTAEIVDRNEFVGDIYIKPARSINYIQLNFVAVRTGVSFEEVVGRVG